MRLVDREQRHLGACEHVEAALGQQALRRDVQQLEQAAGETLLDLALRERIEARIEERGLDADLAQRIDLVLHQRDQRRDDDRACRVASSAGIW